MSSGGNDALQAKSVIYSSRSTEALLEALTMVQHEFRIGYEVLIAAARRTALPTVVCTIYSSVPGLIPIEKTLLSVFNDVIIFEASRAGFPIIDLRSVCTDPKDYSEISPIEPSAQGGMRTRSEYARVVQEHDFGTQRTTLY